MRRAEATFADNFNRADGALGGAWETASGAHTIISGQAAPASGAANSRYDDALDSTDHWCSFKITEANSTDYVAWVRMDDAGAHSCYGYVVEIDSSGDATDYIAKITEGSFSSLGASDPEDPPAVNTGDTITTEVIGNIIRGLLNGAERVRVVDSDFANNVRAGLGQGGPSSRSDDWAAGLFSKPAAVPVVLSAPAGDNSDDTSYTTAAVTAPAGDLVLIWFEHSRNAAEPSDATSVTGDSITNVTKIATVSFNAVGAPTTKLELWAAKATGSSGAITIDFDGEVQLGLTHAVIHVPNVDQSVGTFGIVQHAVNNGDGEDTFATPLDPFADEYNIGLYGVSIASDNPVTPKQGWEELSDQERTSPVGALEVSWTAWADPDCVSTSTANRNWGGIAIEVAALPEDPIDVEISHSMPTFGMSMAVQVEEPEPEPEQIDVTISHSMPTFGMAMTGEVTEPPPPIDVTISHSMPTFGMTMRVLRPTHSMPTFGMSMTIQVGDGGEPEPEPDDGQPTVGVGFLPFNPPT